MLVIRHPYNESSTRTLAQGICPQFQIFLCFIVIKEGSCLPKSVGSAPLHRFSRKIAMLSVKQIWRIWVSNSHDSTKNSNIIKTKENTTKACVCVCVYVYMMYLPMILFSTLRVELISKHRNNCMHWARINKKGSILRLCLWNMVVQST